MAVVSVDGLVKRYGARTAVDGVSLTVERREVFGILGPNGAGKTTTVECIGGLRTPDDGRVDVLGLDPQRDERQLRRRLGMQLQESQLPDRLKVWEALDLYASFHAIEDRALPPWPDLLEQLGLAGSRDVTFRKLSGGQKQRLSIALALVGDPEIVVLDELTTGLDPQARRDTWDLVEQVRARGVTVLLVTHLMEEAERLCDRVAIIDAGRVVALDSPAALVARTVDEQVLRFRPTVPLALELLRALPEVSSVERDAGEIVVRGTDEVVYAVTSLLAREQVVAAGLRIDQPNLDDAFVNLTGRRLVDGEAVTEGAGS